MSKGKCSETFVYEYYSLYYNNLNKEELEVLKSFLKYTRSNIDKLINEFSISNTTTSTLNIIDNNGFSTNVLDNRVIIQIDLSDNVLDIGYEVLDFEHFESSYKIEE